jgi:4-diphosphocytidyl-2-C-methyl-D-erythritol kinase
MFSFPNFKINIGLFITNKRKDGFHDLETIFYPVDCQTDKLEIRQSASSVKLTVKNADYLTDSENNLCVRAYRLLEKEYYLPEIEIILTKNIPIGAGLGGGSADAAFTLKMINELFNLNISGEMLKQYAAKLGSDVAFFIDNKPAFASGRGEVLEPIPLNLSDKHITVVKPCFSVSTADAYNNVTPRPADFLLKNIIDIPVGEWRQYVRNDFEETLFVKYPSLKEIKTSLYDAGALYASLSGSGSALYAISDFPLKLNIKNGDVLLVHDKKL